MLIVFAAGGGHAWLRLKPGPRPPGIAMANGRIEATQIDGASKLAGRIKDVLVAEGDFVAGWQEVSRMDTSLSIRRCHRSRAHGGPVRLLPMNEND